MRLWFCCTFLNLNYIRCVAMWCVKHCPSASFDVNKQRQCVHDFPHCEIKCKIKHISHLERVCSSHPAHHIFWWCYKSVAEIITIVIYAHTQFSTIINLVPFFHANETPPLDGTPLLRHESFNLLFIFHINMVSTFNVEHWQSFHHKLRAILYSKNGKHRTRTIEKSAK